jgi:hypothetical protein
MARGLEGKSNLASQMKPSRKQVVCHILRTAVFHFAAQREGHVAAIVIRFSP